MYQYNLGQAFERVCKQYPSKTAVIFYNEQITFHELNLLCNKIANYFTVLNIHKKDVVAIQNNKTKFGFAAMLACLKLGIIYTNFDYTNPKKRIHKIYNTAKPKLIFADSNDADVAELCSELQIPYLSIENEHISTEILKQDNTIPESVLNSVSGSNPAYIMFTSGSTGIPKGVLIAQHSILNFIDWGKDTYQFKQDDILSNVNPIYFDNSVFDFYCSLFNGLTMIAVNKEILQQPKQMLDFLTQNNCTFWFSVPSMLIYLTNLKLLSKETLTKVRIFSFGGEGYPKPLLKKLYAVYKDQAQFYNVYGPTEGTCICSAYHIQENDMEQDGLAPLGHIAKNFDYLILDENKNNSSVGELYLIGSQLALGYYNDPERTQKSFIPSKQFGYSELMYKTGDLVEIKNNLLYFVGRADNQVKHMGYRIELEEIENAIIKIYGVKQCTVVHAVSKNNFSKIIAFIATNQKDEKFFYTELKKLLPDYMIPSKFYLMQELPKNPNGKIDKQFLMQQVMQ